MVFRVADRRHQARDQGGDRGAVRGQGAGGEHAGSEGQDQALQGPAGRAVGRQEGLCAAGRGSVDRSDHRSGLRRGLRDGTEEFQPGHAEPSRHGADRPQRAVEGQAGQGADRGQALTGGRNNHGRITSRFRGGGHKQAYRIIDFKRRKFDVPATVERLEYDPNRTAFIALIKYQTASWPTSWRRSGCGSATRWSPARAWTSSRATRCRWRRSRSAPSCTMSS